MVTYIHANVHTSATATYLYTRAHNYAICIHTVVDENDDDDDIGT